MFGFKVATTCIRPINASKRLQLTFARLSSTDSSSQSLFPRRKGAFKARKIFNSVEQLLESGDHSGAASYFLRSLTKAHFENPSRFRLYEETISLFLRHGHPIKAAMICGRMTAEGFIPSPSIRTQMRIMKLAEMFPTEENLLEILQEAFSQESYDEACLRDLLNLLVDSMQCDPTFIDKVAETFLQSRDPGYVFSPQTTRLLVHIHSQASSAAGAQRWLNPKAEGTSSGTVPPDVQSYTTLLRDLGAQDPEASAAYHWVLQRMQEDGLAPDLPFFNALLASEISRGHYDKAFAIYQLLMKHRTRSATPDAYTYASLFRAQHRISQPHSVHTRRHRRPQGAPSPRQLYQEMLDCHDSRTRGRLSQSSPVVDTTVLNKALRVFMRRHDYAAVYVVLRTFWMCKLSPTLATYRVVVGGLLARIQNELRRLSEAHDPSIHWTWRFLGLGSSPAGETITFDNRLFEMVLHFGQESRLGLAYIPAPPSNDPETDDTTRARAPRKTHQIPSVPVFTGMEKPPTGVIWSITPLERIVRRAILAAIPYHSLVPSRDVSAVISEAKVQMFPRKYQSRGE